MRMICHDIHKQGYVALCWPVRCLREWQDVKCFTDYPRGEMVLTEDAVAPHQTPMWECSGHLLAGCYIAKYGLVNASLLPFLRGDISPTFFLLAHLPCQGGLQWNWKPNSLQKEQWVENQSWRQHAYSSKGDAEKNQLSQPTNPSWKIKGLRTTSIGNRGYWYIC